MLPGYAPTTSSGVLYTTVTAGQLSSINGTVSCPEWFFCIGGSPISVTLVQACPNNTKADNGGGAQSASQCTCEQRDCKQAAACMNAHAFSMCLQLMNALLLRSAARVCSGRAGVVHQHPWKRGTRVRKWILQGRLDERHIVHVMLAAHELAAQRARPRAGPYEPATAHNHQHARPAHVVLIIARRQGHECASCLVFSSRAWLLLLQACGQEAQRHRQLANVHSAITSCLTPYFEQQFVISNDCRSCTCFGREWLSGSAARMWHCTRGARCGSRATPVERVVESLFIDHSSFPPLLVSPLMLVFVSQSQQQQVGSRGSGSPLQQ